MFFVAHWLINDPMMQLRIQLKVVTAFMQVYKEYARGRGKIVCTLEKYGDYVISTFSE